MILIIRISGMVDVPEKIENALFRLRLRRKYSAVLIEDNPFNEKLLKKIRNYISYGRVSEKVIEKLVTARGEGINGKKIEVKKVLESLGKKKAEELGIKPFFRLHPPRGGIESKKHAGVGKGVLGYNKKIDELLGRML